MSLSCHTVLCTLLCGVDTLPAAGVELVTSSVTLTHEGTLDVLAASATAHTRQRHTLVLI